MEGIIYKTQPYQEHARLLFVYTKKGKKTLLAQGSQKLNNSNRILAQFLTHIEFKENTKSFFTLSEAKIRNDFKELKEDYVKTKSAALILEIIDHLIVDVYSHESIFQEVMLALVSPHIKLSALSFALKILKPLGYEINLFLDGRKVKGLSIEKGSIIYDDEADYVDLDVKSSTYLLKLMYMPYLSLEPVSEEHIPKIKEFILKYYQYHLQTTLKNLQ
ncbi:MAG: DNA repair protein RecO [Acholeplasmataceae bacterium]|jgi:DNA repair protein RecO (recombination protein O)|nr:DNA repair protein RecO [Acholeplasmataceae bacterium]